MAGRRTVEGLGMSDFWRGKRVLVTGATGLIGSWLAKALLARGAVVTALVKDIEPQSELYRSGAANAIRIVQGRLEEYAVLERAVSEHAVDSVFHLAAQAIVPVARRSPLATFESNIRGTYHVLEACRQHQDQVARVVVASSDKAYGEQAEIYREDMRLDPAHPYDVSKACGELLARSYTRTYGLPVAVARCGNIFGGGDLNWSRIVPGTIRAALLREPLIIRSNGRLVRDYFFVKDAAEAYLALGEQVHRPEVSGEAFNFSMETPLSVLDLVARLQKLLAAPGLDTVIAETAQDELTHQALSAKKARDVLGWRPRWELEEGLAETIAWYQEYFAREEVAGEPSHG